MAATRGWQGRVRRLDRQESVGLRRIGNVGNVRSGGARVRVITKLVVATRAWPGGVRSGLL